VVYSFTQTAEPALAVGFISYIIAMNYRHYHHLGKGQRANCPIVVRSAVPATLDGTARAWRSAHPAIPGVPVALSFTLERHRLLLGAASDGVCPCLPKWARLNPGKLGAAGVTNILGMKHPRAHLKLKS
jgi:hypothetical protein